jgi:hypothetical protein
MEILYSTLALITYMLFSGVVVYIQLKKKQKNWKYISFLLLLFCTSLFFAIFDKLNTHFSSQEQKKEIIDSTLSASKRVEDKFDTSQNYTKRIENKIDTSLKVGFEFLSAEIKKMFTDTHSGTQKTNNTKANFDDVHQPALEVLIENLAHSGTSQTFELQIGNNSQDTIYNVTNKAINISYDKNKTDISNAFSFFTKQSSLPPGFWLFRLASFTRLTSDQFLFYTVKYENKHGISMVPVKKIYGLIGLEIKPVTEEIYNKIKTDLQKHGVW